MSKKRSTKQNLTDTVASGIRRPSLPNVTTIQRSSITGGPGGSLPNVLYSSLPMTSTTEVESLSENEFGELDVAVVRRTSNSSNIPGVKPKRESIEKAPITIPKFPAYRQKQNELEAEFMSFVSTGNVSEAREFLRNVTQGQREFDVNQVNFDGYSPLHIAVHRQDEEMLKLLLSLESINLYDTIFYAIREGDMGMVKEILEFEMSRHPGPEDGPTKRPSKMPFQGLAESALERLQFSKDSMLNSRFDDDVSPLMLSAQCGQYELIKFFFGLGQRLPKIDDVDCKTDICKSRGELKNSIIRLHIYQAIANPVYICFMALEFNSVDPVLEAFNLIKDLRKAADMEPEVKNEYNALIEGLEEFTGDLLGLCRDDTEVELMLKQRTGYQGNMKERYPRLILALKSRQIAFVTHPHCQQVLATDWYRGFQAWRAMSPIRKIVEFIWRTVFLVPISLWLCIYSSCWTCGKSCTGVLTSPVSRFIHSLGSYLIFLTLLILEVNLDAWGDEFDVNDKAPPRSSLLRIIVEIAIFVFAIGQMISTLKQFCFNPAVFFHQLWNIYEVLLHIFFILAYTFWIIAFIDAPPRDFIIRDKIGGREYWQAYHPLLIGEAFFSLAIIMSFGKLFRVFQLHSRFGPIQIVLGKMLKKLTRLILPFLCVILAFAVGLTTIYKSYQSWTDVDENGEISVQTQGYTSFRSSLETLFWGLYGMAGRSNLEILKVHNLHVDKHGEEITLTENYHHMTEGIGKAFFAFYHVTVTVALLNTSVAMITGAIGEVFDDVDREFKMGRTQVWILYSRDMKVPPPFNTIALIRNLTFLRCFGIATGNKKWKRGVNMDRCCYVDEVNPESDKKLRTAYSFLVKNLIQRYFHAKATISLREPAKLDQVNKVRETVGELREAFKTVFAGVTGTMPTRKIYTSAVVSTAIAKFKKSQSGVVKKKGLIDESPAMTMEVPKLLTNRKQSK